MLNSCAAGIGVVNIDNGFGAAILAGQILRTAAKFGSKSNLNSLSTLNSQLSTPTDAPTP
jgi:hypothetical protein